MQTNVRFTLYLMLPRYFFFFLTSRPSSSFWSSSFSSSAACDGVYLLMKSWWRAVTLTLPSQCKSCQVFLRSEKLDILMKQRMWSRRNCKYNFAFYNIHINHITLISIGLFWCLFPRVSLGNLFFLLNLTKHQVKIATMRRINPKIYFH